MFPGSVYFLNNLLSLVSKLNGKVVFLSGRADKFLAVTKKALLYNGVSPTLLEGSHVLWYLKPSSGKINFSEDTQLDFQNDKAGMVTTILGVDPRFEVAGFVDNEARNIFSLVGHNQVRPERLYFFRSVDATWSAPADGDLVGGFLDRIRNNQSHFTQFESYLVIPQQAKQLKALFTSKGITYLKDSTIQCRQPKIAANRQLSIYNELDCQTILSIVCP